MWLWKHGRDSQKFTNLEKVFLSTCAGALGLRYRVRNEKYQKQGGMLFKPWPAKADGSVKIHLHSLLVHIHGGCQLQLHPDNEGEPHKASTPFLKSHSGQFIKPVYCISFRFLLFAVADVTITPILFFLAAHLDSWRSRHRNGSGAFTCWHAVWERCGVPSWTSSTGAHPGWAGRGCSAAFLPLHPHYSFHPRRTTPRLYYHVWLVPLHQKNCQWSPGVSPKFEKNHNSDQIKTILQQQMRTWLSCSYSVPNMKIGFCWWESVEVNYDPPVQNMMKTA